jgi:hypothetical protein
MKVKTKEKKKQENKRRKKELKFRPFVVSSLYFLFGSEYYRNLLNRAKERVETRPDVTEQELTGRDAMW